MEEMKNIPEEAVRETNLNDVSGGYNPEKKRERRYMTVYTVYADNRKRLTTIDEEEANQLAEELNGRIHVQKIRYEV